MPGSVNVGGAWKTVNAASVNVNGSWKTVSSGFVNVNGTWKQWYSNSLVVFDYTNPNTNTGGWTGFFNGGSVNPILTANSDHLYVQAPWWCDGDARSNNNINATGAKSVTIKVSSSVATPTYYSSSFSYTNTSGGWSGFNIGSPSNANFGVTTITVPISDAGNGKIKLNVVNSEGGGVKLYAVIFNF